MAIPILKFWKKYYTDPDEGLGSSYERIILHNKLMEVANRYKVKKVLEAPSFGFTGMSGINSLGLAVEGLEIDLVDHDEERIELIEEEWSKSNQKINTTFLESYDTLPFTDGQFDMSWNFSALWFVDNIQHFLEELTRITDKIIVLAVPNRSGIGYLSQKYSGKDDLKRYLKEENIIPATFKPIMASLGWKLVEHNYIDCPPWPDIGMAKEDFLRKFHLGFLVKERVEEVEKEPLTVLDYWRGNDDNFSSKMLKYYWLEKYAPSCFKSVWAHHKYFVFKRKVR